MKKSPVAGVSGAIRIQCLSKADLAAAERHGKRLDMTSQARAITDDPAITSTGLDLRNLYKKHVGDALVHKCRTVAKHVIIQFPKDLVDGEDADFMLRHARKIVERIFGDQAIFADRIDRDERGRHIVDLFVAPKAIKSTKKTTRLAVTVTKHEKALTAKYGRRNSTYGRGQAAQDALLEYFRDEMRLPGVERGSPKVVVGPDQRSAEQLRDAELAKMERAAVKRSRELDAREAKVASIEADARAARKVADEEREAAKRLRQAAEAEAKAQSSASEKWAVARAEAEARSENAAALLETAKRREELGAIRLDESRALAEKARQEADAAQVQAKAARAECTKAEAEADRARAMSREAEADANRTLREAAETQLAANRALRNAADSRAAADAILESVTADRRKLDDERSVHLAQLALLTRASDDGAGLELRTRSTTFTMNANRMTPEESTAFRSPWSAGLNMIARTLATALERIRRLTDRLAVRETELEKQKRDTDARDAKLRDERERHAKDVEGHRAALRLLDHQQAEVTEREKRAKDVLAAARGKVDEAAAVEAAARSALATHQRWVMVVNELRPFPDGTSIMGDRIVPNPLVVAKLTPPMAAFIKSPAPDWARMVVAERFASSRERQKAQSAAVALEKMLGEARSVLSPAQQQTVAQTRQVMRQHGFGDPGMGL